MQGCHPELVSGSPEAKCLCWGDPGSESHRRQGNNGHNESTLEIRLKHPKHVIPNAREESVIYCNGLPTLHRLRFRQILHSALLRSG